MIKSAIRGDLSSFSENVKCNVSRAGTARAPAGPLRGPDKVYIYMSGLVAWLTQSRGYRVQVPLWPIYFLGAHIYAVTQTVKIRGIIMTATAAANITAANCV